MARPGFARGVGHDLSDVVEMGTIPRACEMSGGLRPGTGPVVCRACSTAWGCKSPAQPDGGEVRAKRKGVAARRGLKEAWSEAATRRTETGYEAARVRRADDLGV